MKNSQRVRDAFRRLVTLVLLASLLFPTPALADCPPWHFCQLENKAHDLGNTAKDVGTNILEGGKKVLEGGGKILRGAGQLLTGHPGDAWASVIDAF